MLNLSIMPLDPNHVEEICQDIITSERDGVYAAVPGPACVWRHVSF